VLAEPQKRGVLSAAQALGIKLHVLNASVEQDFDRKVAVFLAVQSGAFGPSQHFAATQQFGRFRSEADIQ
jgi:hypothetical protein